MRQEDYNSMMRYPWDRSDTGESSELPLCPCCGDEYLGDGLAQCADCESKNKITESENAKKIQRKIKSNLLPPTEGMDTYTLRQRWQGVPRKP